MLRGYTNASDFITPGHCGGLHANPPGPLDEISHLLHTHLNLGVFFQRLCLVHQVQLDNLKIFAAGTKLIPPIPKPEHAKIPLAEWVDFKALGRGPMQQTFVRWYFRWEGLEHSSNPIGCMYSIFTYIYHKNHPNVGKYTIHGSYGKWWRLDLLHSGVQ